MPSFASSSNNNVQDRWLFLQTPFYKLEISPDCFDALDKQETSRLIVLPFESNLLARRSCPAADLLSLFVAS
jgi:hypothetical protein